MKLKEDKFNYIFENDYAMICEIGFYLGENNILDSQIKDLIKKCDSNDGYVIFYVFCKFIYDMFKSGKYSNYNDIYELIDNEYMELFGIFKVKYFEKEQ